MDELPGALGTSASLALRLGQAIFAVASLLFMCLDIEFYSYTAFCIVIAAVTQSSRAVSLVISSGFAGFLVTIMGLVIPWSLTLAVVDAFSVFRKRTTHQSSLLSMIIVGDWILSFLSLAASSSTASVSDLLIASNGSICTANLCTRYQLSAAMAFLSWFLSLASSLFNLWLLPTA